MKIHRAVAARSAALLVTLAALGQVAEAAPVAYTERSFSVAGGYAFDGTFFGVAGVEIPLDLSLPVDFSIGIDGGYKFAGPLIAANVKALLLPSLLGNPPLALAVGVRVSAGEVNPFSAGARFALGPIVSLDYSPFVLSASTMLAFGGGPFGADLNLTASYYMDPLVFDLAFFYSTGASGHVTLGLRYLF
jgi:hypothetical protein